MSNLDVVARFQLRAEEFGRNSKDAFAAFNRDAVASAQQARTAFDSNLSEIQTMVRNALKMPNTGAFKLDVDGIRQAATAAETEATAFRDVAVAAERAALASGDTTSATRLYVAAAQAAAVEAEGHARALNLQTAAAERVQEQMNLLAPATGFVGRGMKNTTEQSAALRSALQGVSYSVQDTMTQVSMGTNVLSALSVQGMQAAGAFAYVEGKAGSFGRFMLGPYGLAIGAALLVTGKLTEGLFSESEAHKAAQQAAEQHRKAVDDLARAQEKAILTAERKQALDVAQIKITLDAAIATRQQAQAELAAAASNLQSAQRRVDQGGGDEAAAAAALYERDVNDIRAKMADNSAEIAKLKRGVDTGFARMIEMRVDARSTPEGRIKSDYERAKAKAMSDPELLGEANAGRLAAKLRELNSERERELKLLEESKRAARATGGADSATLSARAAAKMLRDALPGVRITSTTGGKHATNSYHYKNQAVDFVPAGGVRSMTKADVREIFHSRGIDVVELLGPGDAGHSDHFHVAWTRGRNELANFAAEAKRTAEAQKLVDRAQKDLASSLDALEGRYDPVTAAANRYAEALADIAALEATVETSASHLDKSRANLMRAAAQAEYLRAVKPDLFAQESDGGWLEQRKKEEVEAARFHDQLLDDEARRAQDSIRDLGDTFYSIFSGRTGNLWDRFEQQGFDAVSAIATEWVRSKVGDVTLRDLQKGAGYGAAAGSVFSAITGGKENRAASAIGGAIGELAGKEIGKTIGKEAGGLLTSLGKNAGPIGAALGGVLGNLVGGLFTKKISSQAGITTKNGEVGTTTAIGNDAAARRAAGGLADTVSAGLQQIADLLGATVSGTTDVQIGTKNGKIHVNPIGGKIGKKGSGDIGFGDDEQAAIAYAISESLKDGILGGISNASMAILRSGQDLQQAINKALLIENVPKELKAELDPVGAALDALNTKWKKTCNALVEGGASAEQMAQAQQLYNLQLAEVKNSTASASQALKDFLAGLKVGSNSPYSLRDQEAAAQASLKPFLDQINGGQAIDQSKYQAAAASFLDIERQLYGSTQQYFDAMEAIQAPTNTAISKIDNAVPITPGVPDPFTKQTADAVQTGNEIADSQTALLARAVDLLQQITGNTAAGGGSSFIGEARGFLARSA